MMSPLIYNNKRTAYGLPIELFCNPLSIIASGKTVRLPKAIVIFYKSSPLVASGDPCVGLSEKKRTAFESFC